MRRHIRLEKNPRDKLSGPLTASQDIGWEAHKAEKTVLVAPKKSCPETIYQAELIKAGVYF